MSKHPQKKMSGFSRRDFIKTSTAAGTVVALAPYEKVYAQLHSAGAFWKRKSGSASYSVGQSLRFSSASSQYLSRTFVAGSRTTWTLSFWVKRNTLGADQCLFSTVNGQETEIMLRATDILDIHIFGAPGAGRISTNRVFRDPGAWSHIVIVWDSNNSTPFERERLYINGVRETSFSSYTDPSLGQTSAWNSNAVHNIGRYSGGASSYSDAYLAEIRFIDGQAIEASSFGNFDSTTGQWIPKSYTGTYGTTGFYVKFSDNSNTTSATLGKDTSGNNNDWTPNGFTVNEQVLDSPTNNFCTLNPTWRHNSFLHTYEQGNLKYSNTSGVSAYSAFATTNVQFKSYYEVIIPDGTVGGYPHFGTAYQSAPYANWGNQCGINSSIGGFGFDCGNKKLYVDGSVAYNEGVSLSSGDVVGIAYDPASGKIWVSVNGSWLNSGNPAGGTNALGTLAANLLEQVPSVISYSSKSLIINFGQGGQSGLTYDSVSGGRFKYTPPTGFKALSTKNLPTPAIQMASNYFFADSYVTGTSVFSPAQADFSGGDSSFGGYVGWSSNTFSVSGTFAGGGSYNSWNPKFALSAPFEVNFSESWPYSTDLCTSNFGFIYLSQLSGWVTGSSMSGTTSPFWIYFYDSTGTIYENGNNMGNITITNPVKVKTNAGNKFEVYCNGTLAYTSTMNVPSEPLHVNFQVQYNSAAVVTRSGSYSGITMQSTNGLSTAFQPDLIWLKSRTATDNHLVFDSVRGTTKYLSSSTTSVETTDAQTLTAFNSNGATFGTSSLINGNTLAAWSWKAGGAPVVNNAGTISANVSANTTSGFSIVSYTGTGVNNATVGHGLGVTPGFVIIKNRDNTYSWVIKHKNLSSAKNLRFAIDAETTWPSGYIGDLSGSTTLTLTQGGSDIHHVNFSAEKYIAYCFAEVAGFSKIGSYAGNGSADGPFVWCGFRPAFLLWKRSDSGAEHWFIFDSARDTYNLIINYLVPSASQTETVNAGNIQLDFVANGFKVRGVHSAMNATGGTYVFIAFAEAPFKYANAR